jgi:hypothetical protein
VQVRGQVIQGEMAGPDKAAKGFHGGGVIERPLQHPGEVPYGVPVAHELRRHMM